MAQCLLIDRPARLAYLGLALAGLACGGAPGSVVPAAAGPVTSAQVAEWVRGTQPPSHRLHRFKWLFRDDKSSAGGRGSARIAPPDSMRFDVAGPFGSGAASAAVIGEQPLWARAARRGEQAGAELSADVGDVRRGAACRRRVPSCVACPTAARSPGSTSRAPTPSSTPAPRAPPSEMVTQVRRGGRDRRARGDDARFHRRSPDREAHGPECAGPAGPHVPLDRAGQLCA